MAKSIRVSDGIYELAAAAGDAVNRSLADQVEYWARLGAALDAAGITMEQSLQLLGGDATLKAKVLEHVSKAQKGTRRRTYTGDPWIAAHRERIEAEVGRGLRTPESLLLFTRARAQGAKLTFPKVLHSGEPTW